MKLTDLNPRFIGYGGEGISDKDGNPVPYRADIGLICKCPKCGDENHELFVPFANPPDGGLALYPEGHVWTVQGSPPDYSFEYMTLTPSILRKDGCGWHGFITNGQVIEA